MRLCQFLPQASILNRPSPAGPFPRLTIPWSVPTGSFFAQTRGEVSPLPPCLKQAPVLQSRSLLQHPLSGLTAKRPIPQLALSLYQFRGLWLLCPCSMDTALVKGTVTLPLPNPGTSSTCPQHGHPGGVPPPSLCDSRHHGASFCACASACPQAPCSPWASNKCDNAADWVFPGEGPALRIIYV